MRIFHWLSATFRRRSRRERIVMAGGALVTTIALVGAYGVIPFAQRWRAREAGIAARAEQLARLRSLINGEDTLRVVADELRQTIEQDDRVLLEGETAAVASSSLQRILNGYAEESQILVERVDVATEVEAAPDSLVSIPANMTVRGDIYGLVDLLFYLQHGEKLLVIDDLVVTGRRGTTDDDQVLSWTVGLHGYYTAQLVP